MNLDQIMKFFYRKSCHYTTKENTVKKREKVKDSEIATELITKILKYTDKWINE